MSDLGSMLDREQIKELTATYCWHVTRADAEAVSRLFIEDGIFDAPYLDRPGRNVSRGQEQIGARLRQSLTPGKMCPFVANHIIRIDGDLARGTCVMRNSIDNGDGSRSELVGYYRDDYLRQNGAWLFARRVWRLYTPSPDFDDEPPV